MVTLSELGSDVVASGRGTLNLDALILLAVGHQNSIEAYGLQLAILCAEGKSAALGRFTDFCVTHENPAAQPDS